MPKKSNKVYVKGLEKSLNFPYVPARDKSYQKKLIVHLNQRKIFMNLSEVFFLNYEYIVTNLKLYLLRKEILFKNLHSKSNAFFLKQMSNCFYNYIYFQDFKVINQY